ncbi:MAG: arsenite/tail-anchored protein-transporting ATPase [Acidimicrobiaceae bacterium]|nr:arsenite/tail-anchored protein-transporting ATPase [Acidimicrobiaceae bacterium]
MGKTTTAAATAVVAAGQGLRTLVVSTDTAHSLADAFGLPLGDRPSELAPGLYGQQINALARLEEQWGGLRGYLATVLDWAGVRGVEAEELTLLPGLEEVIALTDLADLADDNRFDLLVVDCAPTAETLRLLSLPEVLAWWMDRVFPLGRQLSRVVGPVVRQFVGVPVPEDSVFGALDRLYQRLSAVKALLADRQRTGVRLVTNAEAVVIAETRRTATYLALFGYRVDAVVVNRLLPADLRDPFFERWITAQSEHLAVLDEAFAPVPVLRSLWAAEEPIGIEHLGAFAHRLYGERDPSAWQHDKAILAVEEHDDGTALVLELPFTERDGISLVRRGDELHVTVGPYRRALFLPDSLRRRKIVDASVRDDRLTVVFAPTE